LSVAASVGMLRAMSTRFQPLRHVALLILPAVLAVGCVRDEAPAPRSDEAPRAPETRPSPDRTGEAEARTAAPALRREPMKELRDLSGRAREPKRGVTPGALEAEGDANPPRTGNPDRIPRK